MLPGDFTASSYTHTPAASASFQDFLIKIKKCKQVLDCGAAGGVWWWW